MTKALKTKTVVREEVVKPRPAWVKPKNLDEIEAVLKADIKWAIEKGPGWDRANGARLIDDQRGETTKFVNNYSSCGVCAIGALVVRRQPIQKLGIRPDNWSDADDVSCAAKMLGRTVDWVERLYYSVAEGGDKYARAQSPEAMAYRLCQYADSLQRRSR